MNRRAFVKTAALAAGGAVAEPVRVIASRTQASAGFFGVHEFVERNPDAVFIMKTSVGAKTDGAAMKLAGLTLARDLFVPKESGIPLTRLVPVKPNIGCSYPANEKYSIEYGMGIVTDPFFVEGIIEGMKELGLAGKQFYIREVNCPGDFAPRGYAAAAERTGAEIRDMSAAVGEISANDIVWKDAPKGIWFRRIPYLWPVNTTDSFLVNIAKLKADGMGMSLTVRNLQGAVANNYQAFDTPFATPMIMEDGHRNPTAFQDIQGNYNRHVSQGIPRWDKPGSDGGIWQEVWSTRAIDNASITTAGIHIIEGVYGRDGNGVFGGPNPAGNEDNPNGEARDTLANVVIFGKNPFHTDIIGHWLAGHEPGNFGLFRLAKERGLAKVVNPMKIPVYEWFPRAGVKLTPLTDFSRTPLKTFFLQRNYLGQKEPYYHLCNEPCIYPKDEPAATRDIERPRALVLRQNRPNPFNPSTSIEYSFPHGGYARLELFDATGRLVEILADGPHAAGRHLAVWNGAEHASGVYFYRLRWEGFSETGRMVFLK